MAARSGNGQFRAITAADFGIGGVCPTCNHLLVRHYDGDPRDEFPHPQKFRFRCFTCEPKTETELKLEAEIEAAKPKPVSIFDLIKRMEG